MPNFITPFKFRAIDRLSRLSRILSNIKMSRAWRAAKANLLKQVDNVLKHGKNEDIYFNGHRYLYLDGKYWKDHKNLKRWEALNEWTRLRDEIEEMEV